MMNTADAKQRGIAQGDRVHIKNRRGTVEMYAIVTDDIVLGAIEASGMGGGPLGPRAWQDACANDVTDLHRYDPISGFPVYKALLCDVVKVAEGNTQQVAASGEYTPDAIVERHEVNHRIYLDHNATTPLDEEVKQTLIEFMECYGNPSSIYAAGKEAHHALETARRSVGLLMNCTARRIIFTGGGSESNNLAIKGVAFANVNGKNHIITTTVEHPSVLSTCQWLEDRGFWVTYLPVDKEGMVNPDDLKAAITEQTCLISVMMANNETGTLQPIPELAAIAKERGICFHTDGVQAAGKIPIDVGELGVDLLTMSAHKLHGPKGIGVLFARKGVELSPLITGGSQERGLRAGTENIMGICGFGKAAELAIEQLPDMAHVRERRDRLEHGIQELIPDTKVNGHRDQRLPNTLSMTFPGMRGESLVLALDQRGIAVSSGSACHAGMPEPSHVLLAMGLSEEEAHCALRFSLGRGNTVEEIDRTLLFLKEICTEQKTMVRFVSCR
jgi:cysteine desulfurase NifS